MRGNLYGIFWTNSAGRPCWRLEYENKLEALTFASSVSGWVGVIRRSSDYGASGWDAPTFRMTCDPVADYTQKPAPPVTCSCGCGSPQQHQEF